MEPNKALDLIELARELCIHYHEGQFRKGSNQPYCEHPISVAGILARYGYRDYVTQCISLLHDSVEDSVVRIREIQDKFGFEISNGVFILSRNKGRNFDGEHLSKKEYKERLSFAREKVQRVKVADMVDNTRDLENLSEEGKARKLIDAREFYIPIGKRVAPLIVKELVSNVDNYERKKGCWME